MGSEKTVAIEMSPPIRDEKYIVFKREDFEQWLDKYNVARYAAEEIALPDAVVIRTKDPFAGPALHGYAASMALYVNLSHVNGEAADNLRETGHYFHERAMEADATFEWKLPD